MASHDLSSTKTTILGATPGIDGEPHIEDFHLPLRSRSGFSRIGVVPVHKKKKPQKILRVSIGGWEVGV